MTNARFERVRHVFALALESEPAARRALVERECAGDVDLCTDVLSLLADADAAETYFGHIEAKLRDTRAAEIGQHWGEGRLLGPYRLVRRIGAGGMGVVWLAERADGQFERQVAVKLLAIGLDDTVARHRFEAERRILASLDHPNIAQLIDAGIADDGRPYLVMEYVAGRDLATHAREQRLDVRARVALAAAVVDAVQYAHQRLVVHRDLKPANILVRDDGAPKLLDFGIARLLEPHGDSTITAGGAFTPAYAAPEQRAGRAASTATDVYALGVILYELVAGARPDPDAPVDPPPRLRAARPDVDRDLDAIVGKAMQADPAQRYASAAQLADDLRRWLAGLPVAAHRDDWRHRARLWVRRHPAAAAALLVAAIAAPAVTIHTEMQARRVAAERDRAERLADLLVDVFAASDPASSAGRAVSAREMLDRGAPKVRERTDLDAQTRGRLLMALGRAYLGLGEIALAEPLLTDAGSAFASDADGALLHAVANVHLGEQRRLGGKLDEAERLLRDAATTLAAAGPDYRTQALWAQAKLGRLLVVRGDPKGARAVLEPALAGTRALVPPEPRQLSERLNDLASVEFAEGKFDAARALLDEVVAVQTALLPADRRGQGGADLATALNNLGLAHMQSGRGAEATELFERALAMRRAHLPAQHPEIAQTLSNLGVLEHGAGRLDDAALHLREALDIRRAAFASNPAHPQIAQAVNNLAMVQQARGELAEAEALYTAALASLRATLGDKHPLIATGENNLGSVLLDAGRAAEAEAHYRTAVDLRAELLPPEHPHQAYSLLGLGFALLDLGRTAEAAEPIERAHALRANVLPAGDPLRAEADLALATLRVAQGRAGDAAGPLEAARAVLEPRRTTQAALWRRAERLMAGPEASATP